MRNIGVLLAVSTLLAARPSAVASHTNAKENSASTPIAASHARGPAVGRKPRADGDADHDGDAGQGLDQAARTCPVRTAERAMAIVRNRSMMPPVMSMATTIAVPWTAAATVRSKIPGVT